MATTSTTAEAPASADGYAEPPRPDLVRRAAAEGLAAFALVFAGCGAIVANAQYGGALDALFGGPVTGASMNPARSFGPALAAGEWSDFWIYIAAPVAGATLGAFAYQLVRDDGPRTPEEVLPNV